mgnify:CR=1
MTLFQLTAVILILPSSFKLWQMFRRGGLRLGEVFFWLILWLGGLTVILLPAVTVKVANLFGIQRGTDLIIYSSVLLLYLIFYRLWLKLRDLEEKIGKITTHLSLEQKDSNDDSNLR